MEKSCIVYPSSYEQNCSRRYPLLLNLSEVDAATTALRLHEEGILPEIIVVNLCDKRIAQEELIRKISEQARLLDAAATRWIIGTGHSAVKAFEVVLDHPTLFGKAACLSSSFEGIEGAPPLHSPTLRDLEDRSSLPSRVHLYFDYGTEGLDECYEPYHRDLGAILRSKGWCDGREFQLIRSMGGTHDTASWSKRLDPALRWLAVQNH